jgi:uncharacterized repeat protein (TIGR04076 family)
MERRRLLGCGAAVPLHASVEAAEQATAPPAPEGFCEWAWADVRSYVSANFHGGDFPTVACRTDGFRPVFFRIERLPPQV